MLFSTCAACALLAPPRVPQIMMAAPDIQWQDASVVCNIEVARGTMQISIRPEEPVDYKPGHILGFEIAHPETGEGLKGPYTVTRCTANDCFDIIYRVIPDGRKTPFMEKIEPGATVRFGGKFGTPVADGMASDVDRVVGIATGAGIGPLVGYAEAELSSGTSKSIEIYCGFRDLADVCCRAELDALAADYPNQFRWSPIISKPMACTAVGSFAGGGSAPSLAALGLEEPEPAGPSFEQGRVSTTVPRLLGEVSATTHFHLVGNGQFVVDMQAGLLAGGVDEARVTTEKYFNGKAEADEDVVKFIADGLRVGVSA